jgi:uroporphyrin-III C-methyltransferase/precorrin-2 dehydrogenase/sirohydrochlorin ferrochelatase
VKRLKAAHLVLYDSLVDVGALRRVTDAQCFCVGKRAVGSSVRQETIHKLMIRGARQGKRVVRLKGGDPFVFGRGAEEAVALAAAGFPVEIVPGVTSAVSAPALAGIPVTHRGVASGFLVLSGHTSGAMDQVLGAVRPNGISLVVLMGIGNRAELARRLIAHGWVQETPAAIVCGASTAESWTWTGSLRNMGDATPPAGIAGTLIVGNVVKVRDAMTAVREPLSGTTNEVMYGSNR